MNEKHYIFGYGSLVSLSSLNRSLNREPDSKLNFQYCYLRNFERVWNLGMDNSLVIPNYKSYFEPKSLIRPDVFVIRATAQNVKTRFAIPARSPSPRLLWTLFDVVCSCGVSLEYLPADILYKTE